MANPCFAQIHPTCIPVHGNQQSKLTLMSESLRNDGRVWVPKKKEDAVKLRKGEIAQNEIPKKTAIFISNEGTRRTETWFPVTLHHVLPKSVAMKVLA